MITVYGIAGCDSCRKAKRWLDQHEVHYRFHDLRSDGVDAAMLERWSRAIDWKSLMNTRSTTWRGLPEHVRQNIERQAALALIQRYPTLIKRPLLERGKTVMVGFSAEAYRQILG